jgi:hypothetical protein
MFVYSAFYKEIYMAQKKDVLTIMQSNGSFGIKVQFFFVCVLLTLTLAPSLAVTQPCNTGVLQTTPDERFAIHGDGTVTDMQTGLMWKRCSEGQSGMDCENGSTINTFDWQQALDQAAAATDAGYQDWRLPNIKELESIVEARCYDPAVNLTVFPNTPSYRFWSSSVYANVSRSDAMVWVIDFNSGEDKPLYGVTSLDLRYPPTKNDSRRFRSTGATFPTARRHK